jgi:hypothetical protein
MSFPHPNVVISPLQQYILLQINTAHIMYTRLIIDVSILYTDIVHVF